jgi:biopolymer transport protein ExbD
MKRSRMRFRRTAREEPEINLIPFIDVLLVVLIFLMLSTTYSRFTEMQLRLPMADAETQREQSGQVVVAVSADGRYAIGTSTLQESTVEALAAALMAAASGPGSVVVIRADARATHQAVVTAMEAARRAGLLHVTFAAQSTVQGR